MTTRYLVRTLANGGRMLHNGPDLDAARAYFAEITQRLPHEPIVLLEERTLEETLAVAQMRAELARACPWAPPA